jgi:hypothetical protein
MAGSVFTATANDGCRTCAAKIVCPINDQGRQVC